MIAGAGVPVQEVNRLLNQFEQMREMMKRMQKGGLAKIMRGMKGFVPGMSFGYGFAVVKKPEGVTAMLSPGSFGHGGAFATQSWADPKRDLFVILLIQRVGLRNADASDVRQALQKAAVEAIKR